MKAGILTTRLAEFLGTASSYEIIRVEDEPGFLTIESMIGNEEWQVRIDLDSDSNGQLRISDRDGNTTVKELAMELGFFDRDRVFSRPRELTDSSVPESITFALEGVDICVDGFPPMPGKRSVSIDLYDDRPVPNKEA